MSHRLDYINSKIVSEIEAKRIIQRWKFKGEKVVFTNGCFDILHKGHVSYLALASSKGNKLVLGLNSDSSVRRQGKGDDRPINDEEARSFVLAALGFVDLVVLFEEDTPISLIENLEPDVLAKGADYDAEQTDSTAKTYIVGSDVVRNNGGEVVTIPFVDGYSTTSILAKSKG